MTIQIQKGDRLLVNLAPFIGSVRRSREVVPCQVVAVDGPYVEISTAYPFRELSLRVERTWIEADADNEALSALLV